MAPNDLLQLYISENVCGASSSHDRLQQRPRQQLLLRKMQLSVTALMPIVRDLAASYTRRVTKALVRVAIHCNAVFQAQNDASV